MQTTLYRIVYCIPGIGSGNGRTRLIQHTFSTDSELTLGIPDGNNSIPIFGRNNVKAGDILWAPSAERIAHANVTRFSHWLQEERGRRFADYAALWRWSVEDLEGFWQAIWDYFGIEATTPPTRVLGRRSMPGAEWFPGARLNYARHVLRGEQPGRDAFLYMSEGQDLTAMGSDTVANRVRTLATRMRQLGIQPGDRVGAVMPNIPQTMVAMLATASIGAIWAVCSRTSACAVRSIVWRPSIRSCCFAWTAIGTAEKPLIAGKRCARSLLESTVCGTSSMCRICARMSPGRRSIPR